MPVAQEPDAASRFSAAGLGLAAEDREAAHAELWADFVAIVRRLRRDCPWDREQTHDSVKHLTIEEAYELVHAIDRGNAADMAKELGDLLLHVVFHAHIAESDGGFTLQDVIEAEAAKLVRRHPHVFGDVSVTGTGEVLRNWEAIKRAERASEAGGATHASTLDGVPHALPALLRAQRVQEKAAAVGFDFPSPADALGKVEEELEELRAIPAGSAEFEEEFGDLLFALVNYARLAGVTTENALRRTIDKFTRRFQHVESRLAEAGRVPSDATLAEMDDLWEEAKVMEPRVDSAQPDA